MMLVWQNNPKNICLWIIDQGKYRERVSKIKWTYREYHVQDNSDVAYKYVKMYCDANQFPALPFWYPHPKPRGARGLSNHYHLRFDPKLGHGICAIRRIPCEYVVCTSILEKTLNFWYTLKEIGMLPNFH